MVSIRILDGSGRSGRAPAGRGPLAYFPDIGGAGLTPAYGGLWDMSGVPSYVLVLAASALLMLLMIWCLPDI